MRFSRLLVTSLDETDDSEYRNNPTKGVGTQLRSLVCHADTHAMFHEVIPDQYFSDDVERMYVDGV